MCEGAVGLVPHTMDPALAEELKAASKKKSLLMVETHGDLSNYAGTGKLSAEAPARSGKLILFTSGTTANPKAIVVDGDRLWSSAVAWAGFHSCLDSDARFYNMLPMSYLGGLFNLGLIPLAARGSVVISDAFSAVSGLKFWREVEQHGVNILWLSPTVLRSLMQLHRPSGDGHAPWKEIRAAFLGMASARLEEKKQFESTFGIPLLENYALSETTFLTSEKLNDNTPRSAASVGSVLPWAEIRIQSTSAETAGEILIKTPFLFDGYLDANGGINLPLASDGWFPTGDLGVLENHVLVLKGRSKDIIKKGGYLLVLKDLEEAAESHPVVAEAAAVGVAHEFYGESAILCLRLKEEVPAKDILQQVKALLATKLAKFKWPTEIVVMSNFPRTESGKIQKRLLAVKLEKREDILGSVAVH